MGVTGLWNVVSPTARPTQLATLNRKRLAVDASIWIYQFLKAVRDKEGNALRNSHVVGFFRRICKLLYFGIKPVFVFDGGAPPLKRETVRGRARRREGRREDAARTAGKLLGMQMQRAAEEEERKRAERRRTPEQEEELPPEQEMIYVDEIGMSNKERLQNRQFKKKDQYHLPDLDISIESMGAPNDPRIMSQAELEEYARQFHSGEDINLYDFSKIDFESPFFLSLPPSDRWNILNAARLRSRLRMGYSKEQLDDMFPDRMAFSRFQIERVRERNELTQRLMRINGVGEDSFNQGGRIAGEKGKEYVLVKNEGVEGGWALGVVSNKGANEADAIDVDEELKEESEEEEDEEDEFEDVAIEGLNRLPKRWARNRKRADYNPDYKDAAEEIAQKRRAVYEGRKQAASAPAVPPKQDAQVEDDELFVGQENDHDPEDEADELFEDVDMDPEDQADLQRAINMSLQRAEDHDPLNVIETETDLFTSENRANGRKVAEDVSARANRGIDGNRPSDKDEDDEDGGFDLQAALAESRKPKYQSKARPGPKSVPAKNTGNQQFGGPLPFESLNLGRSLLDRKRADKIEEEQGGGFEKETDRQKQKAVPLPSWFEAKEWTGETTHRKERTIDDDDHITYGLDDVDRCDTLMRNITQDVIDVDASPTPKSSEKIVIDLALNEADTEENGSVREEVVVGDGKHLQYETGNLESESPDIVNGPSRNTKAPSPLVVQPAETVHYTSVELGPQPQPRSEENSPMVVSEPEERVDWSETDDGDTHIGKKPSQESLQDINSDVKKDFGQTLSQTAHEAEEPEEDFEDVDILPGTPGLTPTENGYLEDPDVALESHNLIPDDGQDVQENLPDTGRSGINGVENPEDDFSDSDEELMRQMAVEAEEHARFASSLNNTRTPAEAARDYEKELKQLRNQQKKDRRDADEVTQVMIQECQALLRLFGLPYITAPMEAEAQCAELVSLGLVDGIVTDDSDIFLFGGTRVYKNMFNAAKFVECYLATDLEKEYALNRTKLIRFAHLLGSDYTEGIPGVGPVTALEILTDFDTLEEFRDWCIKIQMGQLDGNITTPFRKKFRKQAQKMFLPPAFPDTRVDHAYLHPDVDSDPSGFEWGVPDLDALRAFLMATIGWSQERTDEVLVPVIRDMNKREVEGTQANITRFFGGGVGVGGKEAAAPRNRSLKSGRMEKAFGRLRNVAEKKKRDQVDATEAGDENERSEEDANGNLQSADKRRRKRTKKTAIKKNNSEVDDNDASSDGSEGNFGTEKAPTRKRRKAAG